MYYIPLLMLLLCQHYFALSNASSSCQIPSNNRIDCFPDVTQRATSELCKARRCCWLPSESDKSTPYCYFSSDYPTYTVFKSSESKESLQLVLQRPNFTTWSRPLNQVQVMVTAVQDNILRIQLTDVGNRRFNAPIVLNTKSSSLSESPFTVDYSPKFQNFDLQVRRKSDKRLLFSTRNVTAPLLFSDQFIQISSVLDAISVYGLGHRDNFAKPTNQWLRYSFWSHDASLEVDQNLYGVHNFMLALNELGSAFGIMLLNVNAQEVNIQPQPAITYRTIGGVLDFYIMAGPTPSDVIRQYHILIGGATLPPFWSLGFHLCRYGYNSSDKLQLVYERNVKAGVPMDTLWVDIDHMDDFHDFSYDTKNFAGLPSFVQSLHKENRYFVPIIDPAISSKNDPNYFPYVLGLQRKVFIKYGNNNQYLIGKQWPGEVYFPDYTHPNASSWWNDCIAKYRQVIPFDGLWIDMNEPSSFYQGSKVGCNANSTFDLPPYTPRVYGSTLFSQTICPSSRHYRGLHYDLHSLFGHFEGLVTFRALMTQSSEQHRPFIVSRSTAPTSQNFVFHWTGDNTATWKDMEYSINQILNYNMYGIFMVGADVCGFNKPTNEELCVRWHQLGAFYPFFRNHNEDEAPAQDPAVFSLKAQQTIKNAIFRRYTLLPYLYTQLVLSSSLLLHPGFPISSTVFRSMMEEYPTNKEAIYISSQFFWGPALLVVPVLTPGADSVKVYLPSSVDRWFAYETGFEILQGSLDKMVVVPAPINESIPLFVRGGHVVVKQGSADRTAISQNTPFKILIALDKKYSAVGLLFWDNGVQYDLVHCNFIWLSVRDNQLITDWVIHSYSHHMPVDTVTVFGLPLGKKVQNLYLNDVPITSYHMDEHHGILNVTISTLFDLNSQKMNMRWSLT